MNINKNTAPAEDTVDFSTPAIAKAAYEAALADNAALQADNDALSKEVQDLRAELKEAQETDEAAEIEALSTTVDELKMALKEKEATATDNSTLVKVNGVEHKFKAKAVIVDRQKFTAEELKDETNQAAQAALVAMKESGSHLLEVA